MCSLLFLLLFSFSAGVKAQFPGGEICNVCRKSKQNCQYNGNHPKCQTCGKVKDQCEYKGNHPTPEATGYDVTFSCNVSTATLYIDGSQYGTVTGTRFLKTGDHNVKLTAQGYKDLTKKITVNSKSRSFSFTMTKLPSNSLGSTSSSTSSTNIPTVIQQLEKDMVFVEDGKFMMGATGEQAGDASDDENPAHEVTLSSFHICKHEVTQEEWEAVMGNNPSYFKGTKRPVETVSWNDCQAFINKLNKLTGKGYRLPTEAEWEYAARGGMKSQGLKYSGSDSVSDVAWYMDNSYSKGKDSPDYGTHVVMAKQANELGLYDMSGNVYEWCSDRYGANYYSSSPQINPTGPSSGSRRVYRGGGWDSGCRVSNREYLMPSCTNYDQGFRLAQ